MEILTDTEVVRLCGANAAILFGYMKYDLHFVPGDHDENYVFFNKKWRVRLSLSSWEKRIECMNRNQIFRSLNKLISTGLIESANLGNNPYDRTKWYSICKEEER